MPIIAKKLFSAVILLLAGWYLKDFPYAQTPLAVGLILYFLIFQFYPSSWLIILPALLPLLYLAPLTGRLFFDEFDLFILVTVSAYLWKCPKTQKSMTVIPAGGKLILFAFSIIYFIATLHGFLPIADLNDNSFANYYSPLNSLRIAKGFFWSLCILPIWNFSKTLYGSNTEKLFSFGVLLGSLGVFIVMLWERGVFVSLFYGNNVYEPLNSFFDFSTQYRATGLFSEMHVGDSATDGYLVLALPLVGYFLFTSQDSYRIILGVIAMLGVVYSVVVTFSRGVYLGAAAVFFVLPFLQGSKGKGKIKPFHGLMAIACLLIFFKFNLLLFQNGGTLSLLGGLILFMSGLMLKDLFKMFSTTLSLLAIALTSAFCWYLIIHGMLSSKWQQTELSLITAITLIAYVGLSGCGILVDKYWGNNLSFWHKIIGASTTCAISGLIILSLFGSRMEDRFSTVSTDFQTRITHWKNAIDIMDSDLSTTFFGQGIGRYPAMYYLNTLHAKNVDGFMFNHEKHNNYLTFAGSNSLNLSQRISLEPNTAYNLSVDVRTSSQASLVIKLCHRQIIVPYEWNPTCWIKWESVDDTHGNWKTLQWTIPSGKLGSIENYLQAPLMLTIANFQFHNFNNEVDGERENSGGAHQTMLDIDNIALKTLSNENLIHNGNFNNGIDRWYAFYDFDHLPWHIKNLWVTAYFEMGLTGLCLFVLLTVYSLKNAYVGSRNKNNFSTACFLCIIGFQCVGGFGTILDAPRVAFLYYFLLLINFETEHPPIGRSLTAFRQQKISL